MKEFPTKHTKFVLIDANLAAGYYLPASLNSIKAREKIQVIVNSARNGASPELCLFIPNICISEVFGVFAKYFFARWDKHVKKTLPQKLKKDKYDSIRKQFCNDLHNGIIFQQIELDRYHILSTDLISPIDAKYEYYRSSRKRKKQKRMMGGTDHAIIGMGIYLNKIHGHNSFSILTADNRLADILSKASHVRLSTAIKLGIVKTAEDLGIKYSSYIYPRVLNLAKTSKSDMRDFFDVWPLPQKPLKKQPLKIFSVEDCILLSKLRQQSGVGRDKLPYSDTFEKICSEFEAMKSQRVDRNSAWRSLSNYEKKSKK